MKSPGLAAFLTLILPGLGQIYSGRVVRGVSLCAAAVVVSFVGAELDALLKTRIFSGLLGPASYLVIAWDAYACAKEAAAAEGRDAAETPSRPLLWSWIVTRAAILVPVVLISLALLWTTAGSGVRSFSGARNFFTSFPSLLAGVLGAGFGAWLAGRGLRLTYRVALGRERVPASSMLDWLSTISVLGLVLGILFLVVYPGFSGLFRKSAEGKIKGDLAGLRAAVEYYRKAKGAYPLRLEQVARLAPIPMLWPSGSGVPHDANNEVVVRGSRGSGDSGHWGYVADKSAADFGRVYVDCTHTDTRGSAWTSY